MVFTILIWHFLVFEAFFKELTASKEAAFIFTHSKFLIFVFDVKVFFYELKQTSKPANNLNESKQANQAKFPMVLRLDSIIPTYCI